MGISRVTEVTRLDRLDLPVFVTVRPRGRTLRVHAGKGLNPESARLGAVMEALELALAEVDADRPPDAHLSLGTMCSAWPEPLDLVHFAPEYGVEFDVTTPLPSIWCDCLVHGARGANPVMLPQALVRMRPTDGESSALFPWSSNGLASGNSLDEATLHAALEVLERDTVALHEARNESRRVSALPPVFERLRQQWQLRGVDLHVRWLPNEFGLPCFAAWLHEPTSADVNLAQGSGLHPHRLVALARAIAEAAQARLSLIHGGRDDVTHFFDKYERIPASRRLEAEDALVERLKDPRGSMAFTDVPERPWRTPRTALIQLRELMASRGFRWLMRHRLAWPRHLARVPDLHVVKVTIPGCEMLEPHNRRIGPRLLARLAGHA